MKKKIRNFQAHPSPSGARSFQVTYEDGHSRRVHHLPEHAAPTKESEPHGAGSFHDPAHHQALMDRVDSMLRNQD